MKRILLSIIALLVLQFIQAQSLNYTQDSLLQTSMSDSLFHTQHLNCGINPAYLQTLGTPQAIPQQFSAQNSSSAPVNPEICGAFEIHYKDISLGNGIGFDDPADGADRRNTLCAVLTYIQSVIDFSLIPTTDRIKLNVRQSYGAVANPAPTTATFAARAGAYFDNTITTPRIINGFVHDYVTTGVNPVASSIMHAKLQVNFHQVYTAPPLFITAIPINWHNDHLAPIPNCYYDLYTVLLHEITHALGWISYIEADATTGYPVSSLTTGTDQYSGLDFLLHKGSVFPVSLNKLVSGTTTAPFINPLYATSVNVVHNMVNGFATPNLANDIWINTNPAPDNHPVYSGLLSPLSPFSEGSILSHLDEQLWSYSMRSRISPGDVKEYVMSPFATQGLERRVFTDIEIATLEDLGYTINTSYPNSATLTNLPPYSTKMAAYTNYDAYDFAETVAADFPPLVNNLGASLVINLATDPTLVDPEGNAISVAPNTLTNIRGCGNGGNNHNQLTVSPNGQVITYTPRADFYGRAQFGFNLYDGTEVGSYVVYTIDVLNGNNVNYTLGNNMVVNGKFEEGTEVKRLGVEETILSSNLDLGGLREGRLRFGTHFADGHPYNYMANSWFPAGSGDFIKKSKIHCTGTNYTKSFGAYRTDFPSTTFFFSKPNAIGTNNLRYRQIKTSNFFNLKEAVNTCKVYSLEFDYYIDPIANTLNGGDIDLNVRFTNDPLAPPTYSAVESFTPQVGSWQQHTIVFAYCELNSATILDIGQSNTPNGFYIDNLTLEEDPTTYPFTATILTTDSILCVGDSTELSSYVETNICDIDYLWLPSGETTASITVSPTVTTTYTLIADDGCNTNTTTFTVEVSNPILSFAPIATSICNDSALLSVSAPNTITYDWYYNNNLIFTGSSLWVNQSGDYSVNVTDTNGCSNTDTISVMFDTLCCRVPLADIKLYAGGNSNDVIAQNNVPLGSPPFIVDNKLIVIKDTLFVDNPDGLTFNNCKIKMGPDAVIWVDEASLTLNNTHIEACVDSMWQGIYVDYSYIITNNSIIEDAMKAVVMSPNAHNSAYTIENTTFNNNLYSLVCHPLTDNGSIFRGNTISNDELLLYNQYNGVQVDSSFTGILLHQTNGLVIGDASNAAYQNTIRDLRYGIVGMQTSFEVYNNSFENIHFAHSTGASFPSFINPTACIYADGTPGLIGDVVTVGGLSLKTNTFNNFDLGIYAERMNSTLSNNTFTRGQWAAMGTSITMNRATTINDNQMTNVSVGVWTNMNDYGFMTIENNSFNTDPTLGTISAAIGVYGGNFNPSLTNSYNINNNCFDDVYWQGINLLNVSNLQIEQNYLKHSNYGVELGHCNNAMLNSNSVIGDGQSTQMGIKISDSDAPTLNCNYSGFYVESMHFDGQMNATLTGNNIRFSDFGIVIDNAGSIGQQGTFANPNDNIWTGNFGVNTGKPHLYTKNGSWGGSSIFYTRNFPPYDPNFSSSDFIPNIIPVPNYSNPSAPYNFCGTSPNCSGVPLPIAPPPASSTTPNLAALETLALSDTILSSSSEVYNNQERLYEKVKEDNTLSTSSSVLATFVSTKEQEDMGRIVRIKEKINDSLYTEAQAIIDSMQATSSYEFNAKTVYEELLAPYLRGEDFTKLTASELATVRTIAYLCPHTDGLAVYTARVIARYYDNYWIDYVNICERTLALVPQPRLAAEEMEDFKIYPNPAQDVLNITTNLAENETATVSIIDAKGQTVAKYFIDNKQQTALSVADLSTGLYLVNITDNNGTIRFSEKLTIFGK